MTNPFKAIGNLFKELWRLWPTIANRVRRYSLIALPIVKYIASTTPMTWDDRIVILIEKYGVKDSEWFLALPEDQRGHALLEVATQALLQKFPDAKISELQAAIQEALLLHKNEVPQ